MAITDIRAFAHLRASDIETLGHELDAIRRDVEASLGERDAAYIRRAIATQRALEVTSRVLLLASRHRVTWLLGATMLAAAKVIENQELAHNICHGQWDWMNDPEIHSTTWEWDWVGPSAQWKRAHNYAHHTYTNVMGMDDDLDFVILRMTRDEPWRPIHLVQPLSNVLVAALFEWVLALHNLLVHKKLDRAPGRQSNYQPNRDFGRKIARQVAKDYLIYPALAGRAFKQTVAANVTANLLRNLWTYTTSMCGHFPDGAEKFTGERLATESRGEWYLRQILGSADFDAGPMLAFMSGHLNNQIEHHLFPDLPCNRYREIGASVRELCGRYGLPYTTGSLARQYWLVFRTIQKLALPDRLLWRTTDDAPETRSERKYLPPPGSLSNP
jgi:NADPH-dependent stearoyl-CoA 9-desaturase